MNVLMAGYVWSNCLSIKGAARDEWRTAYVNTDENLADLLTKPLSGPKRAKFVRMVLHHVFPEKGNGDMGGD